MNHCAIITTLPKSRRDKECDAGLHTPPPTPFPLLRISPSSHPPQKKEKRKEKNQRHILRQKRHEEAYLPSRILLMVEVFPLKNFPRKQTLIGNGGNSGGGGGGWKQTNKKENAHSYKLKAVLQQQQQQQLKVA